MRELIKAKHGNHCCEGAHCSGSGEPLARARKAPAQAAPIGQTLHYWYNRDISTRRKITLVALMVQVFAVPGVPGPYSTIVRHAL